MSTYGELLFDLCISLLQSKSTAQTLFQAILRQLQSYKETQRYKKYERSWVLKIASEKIMDAYPQHGARISPEEQLRLDSMKLVSDRLKEFSIYLRRLPPADQIALLLKDKFQIPDSEISDALGIPEGALRVRRQQALLALENWIWINS